MSTCFDIASSTGSYPVRIEIGLFNSILEQQSTDIIIADEWFADAFSASDSRILTIPALETMKSLDAIPELIIELRKLGANRQTALLGLGGGIVQDVTAFIASIYMRGLEWTYVPTTLLAMTDSCIGGKSSINVGAYKNLAGTFHPPQSVLIDPELALTLTDEQRVSGLVEAVKICYCRGEETFQQYMDLKPAPSMAIEQIEKLLIRSLLAKKWFIEVDEFDKAERLILNFGHTFGHAVEGASHFRIAHGVGVAVGILCAIELGKQLGRSYFGITRVDTLEKHLRYLLTHVCGLRNDLAALTLADLFDRFQADKKHRTDFYSVILIAQSGAIEILRMPKNEDSHRSIQAAFLKTIEAITTPTTRNTTEDEV